MNRKQPNKDKNTGDDFLFDYFRDNLEDLELPVSDGCWDKISEQIAEEPPKKGKRYILLISSAAAIFLIALMSGIFFLTTDNNINTLTVEQMEAPITNVIPESEGAKEQMIEEQNTVTNKLTTHPSVVAQAMCNNIKTKTSQPNTKTTIEGNKSESVSTERSIDELDVKGSKAIESSTFIGKDNDNEQIEKDEQSSPAKHLHTQMNMHTQKQDSIALIKRESEMQKLQDLYDGKQEEIFAAASLLQPTNKKGGKWGVSASFASATSSKQAIHQTRPISSMSSIDKVFLADKRSDSATDIDYATPFSVGLTISKQLNSRFSIETGIVYSYLSTKYKDLENHSYITRVKLHYVGVPVNVLVNIWDINSRFKLYASAGVMLEKGLKFDFKQENILGNQKIAENSKVSGVQWSLNASAGASYRFYGKWNLYFEPQVSYFFDNNQPISIRTEKETIFTLNTGIRYQF